VRLLLDTKAKSLRFPLGAERVLDGAQRAGQWLEGPARVIGLGCKLKRVTDAARNSVS
jgi:hypothetical protein